jgi:hypothetical protein
MEGNHSGKERVRGHHVRRRKMSALVPEPWRKRMLGFVMVGCPGRVDGFRWVASGGMREDNPRGNSKPSNGKDLDSLWSQRFEDEKVRHLDFSAPLPVQPQR